MRVSPFACGPTRMVSGGWVARPDPAYNFLTWSEDFDTDPPWEKWDATITPESMAGPLGRPAATLTFTESWGGVGCSVGVVPETEYTFSVWLMRGTATSIVLKMWDNIADVVIVEPNVYSETNGSTFTRVSVTFETPAGCDSIYCSFLTGMTGTLHVFGAQLNPGGAPDRYVRTFGDPVLPPVPELPVMLALDFTSAESDFSALSFSGAADEIIDHNFEVQATKANELRLTGLRRIENLYQYSRLKGTGGAFPTGHSRPAGTGSSTEVVSDIDDGTGASAWLHEAEGQRPFFHSDGWNVAVAANTVYTHSVLVESIDSSVSVGNLIAVVGQPSGSSTSAPGNAVVGRCHGKVITGDTAGTVSPRVGLGTGTSATAVMRFSRPMFFKGDYLGEQKWVDYETTYPNSKVASVRYFGTDEAENPIDPETVDGLKVISGDVLTLSIADGDYTVHVVYDDLSTDDLSKSASDDAGIELVYSDFTRPLIRRIEVTS